MNLLAQILHPEQAIEERRAEIYRSLMHWTGKVGGELFGPIPEGTRREFFCLDEKTWVWHEEWTDNSGRHAMTTRYDIRPNGVFKSQGTSQDHALTKTEAQNLYNAVNMYYKRVVPELQKLQNLEK